MPINSLKNNKHVAWYIHDMYLNVFHAFSARICVLIIKITWFYINGNKILLCPNMQQNRFNFFCLVILEIWRRKSVSILNQIKTDLKKRIYNLYLDKMGHLIKQIIVFHFLMSFKSRYLIKNTMTAITSITHALNIPPRATGRTLDPWPEVSGVANDVKKHLDHIDFD